MTSSPPKPYRVRHRRIPDGPLYLEFFATEPEATEFASRYPGATVERFEGEWWNGKARAEKRLMAVPLREERAEKRRRETEVLDVKLTLVINDFDTGEPFEVLTVEDRSSAEAWAKAKYPPNAFGRHLVTLTFLGDSPLELELIAAKRARLAHMRERFARLVKDQC